MPRTHDYRRTGLTSLYAAFNVKSGEVVGACQPRHTAVEFLDFVQVLHRRYPRGDLHVILDNSSMHSTPAQRAMAEERGSNLQPPTPQVSHWGLADERRELCGERGPRHADRRTQRWNGPTFLRRLVDETERGADRRIPQGAQPAGRSRWLLPEPSPDPLDEQHIN